jgi:hypothetical protein
MHRRMEASFEEDLAVLAHLRGYPEDLRHFSNLIKQAHPRGISALRLVLGRPTSSASLIAAVCRYVAEGIPIVSAVEASEILGVPPGRFLEEIAARAGFPAPRFAAEHRRLWRRADIEEYMSRGHEGG